MNVYKAHVVVSVAANDEAEAERIIQQSMNREFHSGWDWTNVPRVSYVTRISTL